MPPGDARGGDAQGLLLSGLDGSNPLGFMAAVGTLRTVGLAEPEADWRMKWLMHDDIWIPALLADRAVSVEALVALLCRTLRRESTPEFDFAKNLNVQPEKFRDEAASAQQQAQPQDRIHADFVAAFGCEIYTTDKGKPDYPRI